METFLLNPNPTAQSPVSQPEIVSTKSDSTQDFSPLMNEAVTNIEDSEIQQDPGMTLSVELPESGLTGVLQEDIDTDVSNEATLFIAITNNSKNLNTTGVDKSSIATVPISYSSIDTASIVIPTDGAITLKTGKTNTQPQITDLGKNTEAPAITPTDNTNTVATSKVESLLLQQIHQILDQGKDNGTIVIRGNELPNSKPSGQTDNLQNLSNPLLPDTKTENEAIKTRQIGIPLSIVDDSNRSTQKSAKLEGVHQNVSEQFLNAKFEQSKGNARDGSENANSGQKEPNLANKGELQQSATSQSTTVAEVKSVEPSFGQQLGQASSSSSQTALSGVEGKFTPGANTPVAEKELVANLIQRFNVNPRLQTSRLTMQLNPAELGSLKVDILVKDDSINANIIAQSQQVLETLEKNMPRLRAVLEEQGFRIDSFEISMDGDGGNQKELFQEQFSSRQQGFASKESSSQKTDSFDTLLNTQEETLNSDEERTGVNLTV